MIAVEWDCKTGPAILDGVEAVSLASGRYGMKAVGLGRWKQLRSKDRRLKFVFKYLIELLLPSQVWKNCTNCLLAPVQFVRKIQSKKQT
jgi:hypothetical protein